MQIISFHIKDMQCRQPRFCHVWFPYCSYVERGPWGWNQRQSYSNNSHCPPALPTVPGTRVGHMPLQQVRASFPRWSPVHSLCNKVPGFLKFSQHSRSPCHHFRAHHPSGRGCITKGGREALGLIHWVSNGCMPDGERRGCLCSVSDS